MKKSELARRRSLARTLAMESVAARIARLSPEALAEALECLRMLRVIGPAKLSSTTIAMAAMVATEFVLLQIEAAGMSIDTAREMLFVEYRGRFAGDRRVGELLDSDRFLTLVMKSQAGGELPSDWRFGCRRR